MVSQEQFEAMSAELFEVLKVHPGINLHLQPTTALAIVGNLQLALRHPNNKGPNSKIIRSVIDTLIDGLAQDNPRIRTLLKRGDDHRFDM